MSELKNITIERDRNKEKKASHTKKAKNVKNNNLKGSIREENFLKS